MSVARSEQMTAPRLLLKYPDLFHQLLFILVQLLVVLNQLGYFIKLERWKLAVLLQELKQVVANLDAMMSFLLDLVLIVKGVSEMEVEGTIFQFETEP